jgi:16S rRNA (guanine527-N7)-methyltransferase
VTSSVAREIDRLVARYELPVATVAQLQALLDALEDEHAPTTVHAQVEAVGVHLADSLAGLELPVVRDAATIADLGAGAGFPGLPLAVALPNAHVALVESIARKCAFITAAASSAGVGNVDVVPLRAEEWHDGIGGNDVITARALAPLGVLVEYAAPLLRDGGVLVAWKGRRDAEEEQVAVAAAAEVGMAVEEIREVSPYEGADHRHLHVVRKVAPTPARYPRRPGMARKRPLGANVRTSSDRPQR